MNGPRVCSFPDLSSTMGETNSLEDSSLEGIATNVKLLLKLLNDHNEASQKGNDPRQAQRLAGMISILDDAKSRIQKSQMSGKKRLAELRRCNTDLKANRPAGKSHAEGLALDDKERLRRDLNMSFAAQKRLGVICSSLGKEKQIMARELSRKVQELEEMEELLNDYRAQNEKLSEKVRNCRIDHSSDCDGSIGAKLEQARREVEIGREMLLGMKQKLAQSADVEGEIEDLEKLLEGIGMKLSI